MLGIVLIIKSTILLVSSILVLLTANGLLRLDDNQNNILYARIHILGVADIACIMSLFALNQPLLALTYLILAPLAAHAIANAYYYGEAKQ
jgi:energy-converting hydrogenase B subunit C